MLGKDFKKRDAGPKDGTSADDDGKKNRAPKLIKLPPSRRVVSRDVSF